MVRLPRCTAATLSRRGLFRDQDPSDLLKQVGKDWFVSQKGGFDTADNSIYGTSTGAGRIGNWESMILYTYRTARNTSQTRSCNPTRSGNAPTTCWPRS